MKQLNQQGDLSDIIQSFCYNKNSELIDLLTKKYKKESETICNLIYLGGRKLLNEVLLHSTTFDDFADKAEIILRNEWESLERINEEKWRKKRERYIKRGGLLLQELQGYENITSEQQKCLAKECLNLVSFFSDSYEERSLEKLIKWLKKSRAKQYIKELLKEITDSSNIEYVLQKLGNACFSSYFSKEKGYEVKNTYIENRLLGLDHSIEKIILYYQGKIITEEFRSIYRDDIRTFFEEGDAVGHLQSDSNLQEYWKEIKKNILYWIEKFGFEQYIQKKYLVGAIPGIVEDIVLKKEFNREIKNTVFYYIRERIARYIWNTEVSVFTNIFGEKIQKSYPAFPLSEKDKEMIMKRIVARYAEDELYEEWESFDKYMRSSIIAQVIVSYIRHEYTNYDQGRRYIANKESDRYYRDEDVKALRADYNKYCFALLNGKLIKLDDTYHGIFISNHLFIGKKILNTVAKAVKIPCEEQGHDLIEEISSISKDTQLSEKAKEYKEKIISSLDTQELLL